MTTPQPSTLAQTRCSLHGIAELVLAGPQYRRSGRIRLRITPGGFATIAEPSLRVDGGQLVVGSERIELDGNSYAQVAKAAGVDVGAPVGVYGEGSAVAPDDVIVLDSVAQQVITQAFSDGDQALRSLAAQEPVAVEPVLWPEHFDVSITVDEVNYGVSAGDGYLPEPYAYVGPYRLRQGDFWNAPFGAARPIRELGGVAEVSRFFGEGQAQASSS